GCLARRLWPVHRLSQPRSRGSVVSAAMTAPALAFDADDRPAIRAAGQRLLSAYDEINATFVAARAEVARVVEVRRNDAATKRLAGVGLATLKDVTDGGQPL